MALSVAGPVAVTGLLSCLALAAGAQAQQFDLRGDVGAASAIRTEAPEHLWNAKSLGGQEPDTGQLAEPPAACAEPKLFFDGRCRTFAWFRNNLTTPGATLVLVEAAKYLGQGGSVLVLEMPNARTTVMKVVSNTTHTDVKNIRRRYIGDYEVLSMQTATGWLDDAGWQHTFNTLEALDGGSFGRTWWEHVAKGGPWTWTWGSDQCTDALGNEVLHCGPKMAIASSGSLSGCEVAAQNAAGIAQGICLGAVAVHTFQAFVIGAAVASGTDGIAAPVVGAAIAGGVGLGVAGCNLLYDMTVLNAQAICEAMTSAPEDEPVAAAVQAAPEGPLLPGTDACTEMGGEFYTGDPILIAGSCSATESGTAAHSVTLGVGDDELDPLEVEVWGDPINCTSAEMITAADHICVIVN